MSRVGCTLKSASGNEFSFMANKVCASDEVIDTVIEEEMDMLLEPENNEEDHKVIAILKSLKMTSLI